MSHRFVKTTLSAIIYLTAFKKIVEQVWEFSILVNGTTHGSNGYLGMRISFAVGGKLQNFHFLAFSTGGKRRTGANYADLVLVGLQNVCALT